MKILPVVQNYSVENKKSEPSFTARPNKKVAASLTDGILKELTEAVQADKLAQKMKSQLTNPEQKGVFFATVAALITATAAQITGILTGEPNVEPKVDVIDMRKKVKKVKNAEGDTYEAEIQNDKKPKFQLSKHKGHQAEHEVKLIDVMTEVIGRMKLQDDKKAALAALYNKFCGANYKGELYSPENELLSNADIAKNLISELAECGDEEKLNNIILKYNKYSLEPDKTDSETMKIIKDYDKITDSYKKLVQQNNTEKQTLVEDFIKNVNKNPLPKSIKQMQFEAVNNYYSENLEELAYVYNAINTDTPDLTDKFLSLLNNKQIANEALQKWAKCSYKFYLNFFEYNSMVKAGLEDDSIKELAKQKRNTKLHSINILNPQKFVVNLPYYYIEKNFCLINNLFRPIHSKDNYTPLSSNEPEKYSIEDIENEILRRSDSYPNLKEHLTAKDKKYLNRGKIQNLLELYYGDKKNTNLFTMHSFLRFIERVVIPSINEFGSMEDAKYCATINKTYINKVKELRQTLNETFKYPVEIHTYKMGDIEAPQFTIPMTNANREDLVLTINNDNKIHTIF